MAQGRIVFVSRNQGMIVVHHEDGFTVVELLGSEGEFQNGDVVKGDWDELGSEPIFESDKEHDAYFQGTWATDTVAISMARNNGGG